MNFNVVRNYIHNFEINLSTKQTITILSFHFCNSFSKDCFCDLFSNLSSFNCFNRNRLIWLTPGQSLKRRCVPWVRIVTCNKVNHIVQHMYRRVWYSQIKIEAQGVTKPHQWLSGKPYMGISSRFKFHERNKTVFDQFFTLSKDFPFCNTISAIWFYIRVDRKNWHLRGCLHWANQFATTPLFPIRAVSLASSQHCHSVDADAQCKWTLSWK